MGKYRVEESQVAQKAAHPDYAKNLKTAENFIKKTEKSLIRGMQVKVCDTQHLNKALLTISYKPPKDAPLGNCATPISLHQGSKDVDKQIEGIFNSYIRRAGEIEKNYPRQPELPVGAIKV